MDNGAVTFESSEGLRCAYDLLAEIFKPYPFHLQRFCTNEELLRSQSDEQNHVLELFCLQWDTKSHSLRAK